MRALPTAPPVPPVLCWCPGHWMPEPWALGCPAGDAGREGGRCSKGCETWATTESSCVDSVVAQVSHPFVSGRETPLTLPPGLQKGLKDAILQRSILWMGCL